MNRMGNFLKGILKGNAEGEDGGGGKFGGKKKINIVIILIIGAILFLAFGNGINFKGGDNSENTQNTVDYDKEITKMESELEEILSMIRGAGEVRVKIDVEKREERVVAKNTKTKNQSRINGEEGDNSTELEESIVTYGQGSGELPLVLSEKGIRPSGVLVVASGAADASVKSELFNAVRALYGLSAHRITVVSST